jgi:hypothetical protein
MWQLMPPSEVDTSKDSEACPPVAWSWTVEIA